MNRSIGVVAGIGLTLMLGSGQSSATVLRPGDRIVLRCLSAIDACAIRAGDSVAVTVPGGLQVDPLGKPEIRAGTRGVAFLKVVERTETTVKFDISSFAFRPAAGRVAIKVALNAESQAAATVQVKKPTLVQKLLMPPLIGLFTRHNTAVVPAGRELTVEVDEEKRW